ncbi:MAG: hypothetical protein U0350_23665 [Caldilineaceae bacterium]
MKTVFSESLGLIWTTIIGCVCLVIVLIVLFGLNALLEPLGLRVEREAVLQSQGYVDGNISGLETYKTEYARLDTKLVEAGNNQPLTSAYQAQQKAILEQMCSMVAKMKPETIPVDITNFIKVKGGCI